MKKIQSEQDPCRESGMRIFIALCGIMGSVIKDNFSTRKIAQCHLYEFVTYLTEMCASSGTAASTRKSLKRKKLPCARTFRNAAHKITMDQLDMICRNMVETMIDACRRSNVFDRKNLLIAVDKHLIPRYDRGEITGLIRSQLKKGSTLFEGYATMQVSSGSIHAILECIRLTPCMDNAELMRKLVNSLKSYGIRERLMLLDREFYSVAVIKVLQDANRKFLMPAVKHAGIKKAIDEFAEGKRDAISQYTLVSIGGISVTVTLIIKKVKKKSAKKKRWRNQKEEDCIKSKRKSKRKQRDADPYDEYIVYATNQTMAEIRGKINEMVKLYRKRWRIEIGYRQIESIRPWTTSKEPAYHLLLFLVAIFMHNMWTFERVANDVDKSEMTLKSLVEGASDAATEPVANMPDPGGGLQDKINEMYAQRAA